MEILNSPSRNPRAAMAKETQASTSSSSAISLIRKGWREVRDSADADLQLMRDRANSFKNLASSLDRELENFFNSASTFSVPSSRSSPTGDIDFVKKLQPKISEFRRVYSAPDFSKRVLEKWGPRAKLGIDLSAIKNAIVDEVEDRDAVTDFDRVIRGRRVRFKEFLGEEVQFGEWEPIRALKTRLRELEKRSSSSVLFGGFKNSEFVEKVRSSLKAICGETQDSKEVQPLDVPELLAYLVKQSGPFLDQFGVRRDICDKIVECLCSKRKNQPLSCTLSPEESSVIGNNNANEELDLRIASVVQSTGHCYEGGFWTDLTKHDPCDGKRHIAIVTTASLPWMTGTAVNPLFRAAYLAKSAKQNVTLLVPWLCESDQELVYPNNLTFSSPEEQESYIRNWLEERIGFRADFNISFYPGKFSKERRSIMPTGDTSQFIPSKNADIAILEEPEHLNWYHHGRRWTDKFNHVVGIVHTNYLEYIKREKHGALQAFLVKHINNWVIRAYCHKVLRLSAATQDLPKSGVCNVHGVNPKFLRIGEKVAEERELGRQAFSKGAYFLGKMVWAKGYKELIDLLAKHKNDLDGFNLDVFGNGEDANEVQSAAKRLDLNLKFLKGRDHADDSLQGYKVFINPSISDVLCTATAEALAMGKFVVCADHPSNDFFRSFPNCLTYKTSEDFVAKVREALAKDPQPLTSEQMYNLSWEAATQRFMEYSDLDRVLNNDNDNVKSRKTKGKTMMKSVSAPSLSEMVDGGLAFAHYCLTGNEILRLCTGAIPGTRDYNRQHCKDLHLLPPNVENPIYGW
ncbi:UDP-Glycosyltransferase superfamily protein isoform 1 [Tripterygium wilfordii]|uniref:Digalactosyldiacylglycerol synthase 1, chloroplastic n=1 Tax=Tripterygium wilfordii TaxID=458696 RepID=A0A7J7DWV6_TRIWF|nr:digalactosyldiacylglycerol synthase 1, chloroplastic-like [Tripterygium wilfordii]KAF5750586.1 UDP-Glycosyltransferase superfamily protein isoform 1 [Tripterygium wilfordii]